MSPADGGWFIHEFLLEGRRYRVDRDDAGILVEGEKDLYLWNGSEFESATPRARDWLRSRRLEFLPARLRVIDPVCPVVELTDAAGRVYFSHRYDAFSAREKLWAASLHVLSELRAPLLQLRSFLGSDHSSQQRDRAAV
ncbi:MAG: hypothetical protein ACE5F1_21115 [Planctomycetota bacterium]